MSCEKCKKVTKQQQQIVDHSKAVKANNEKMQKEYVQLHAQVGHYQKELESIKKECVTFWMENRSFDQDTKEIKKLMSYHNLIPLRRDDGILGINVLLNVIELRKNIKGELGIHIPGDCNYLMKDKDNNYGCTIHEKRPIVCREYYCEKIIKKALEKAALMNGVHI